MSQITFKGQRINTVGKLPVIGDVAPNFKLTKADLSEITLDDFINKRVLLSIFVSVDTEVCATSTYKFNEVASQLDNVAIITVSADLPFALNRFCGNKNLSNITLASAFRHPEFGYNYGVTIVDSPLSGLLARALVVIDIQHKVLYSELVPEITQLPNYDLALAALK